jgi:hypothetical protein
MTPKAKKIKKLLSKNWDPNKICCIRDNDRIVFLVDDNAISVWDRNRNINGENEFFIFLPNLPKAVLKATPRYGKNF